MERFNICLPIILKAEGGFVNHPSDNGRATNLGITIGTLTGWLKRQATIDDVKALRPDTVKPIYWENYWKPARCNELPVGVDLMAFDLAVNSGPVRARRLLQQALGVKVDGNIGVITLGALEAKKPQDIIKMYAHVRREFVRGIVQYNRSQEVFLLGWLNRIEHIEKTALKMAKHNERVKV